LEPTALTGAGYFAASFTIATTETRCPSNPLGIKGAGNAGIICTHAALANAVADALGPGAPALTALPLRADAVRALIRAAERRGDDR